MKRWTKIPLCAVVIAGAAALSGTPAVASGSGSASAAASGHRCLTLSGVTEQTLKYSYVGSPPVPTPIREIGDTLTYWDEIYDAQDNVIGQTVGMVAAVRRTSNGRLITEYHETVEVPGGRVMTTGYMDREAMIDGGVVHLRAVGVSGKYAGKTGYRDWWILPPVPDPPTADNRVGVKMVLC